MYPHSMRGTKAVTKIMTNKKQLTMPRLMVEGSGQCADLRYGSGFLPVDPVVFLDEGKRRTLVVPQLEYARACNEARDVVVLLPEEAGVSRKGRRGLAAWASHLLHLRGVKRVAAGAFLPASILRELEKSGVRVHLEPESIYPERAIKRDDEIDAIMRSQRAAVAGMRAAERLLRAATVGNGGVLKWKGKTLTAGMVRTAIDTVLMHHDCIARDTIVAGGAQAADPHERGHGPLRAGTSIVIDIFPQHKRSGYWGDITRTFCKGRPSPALAHMYTTVLKAQVLALARIKPGSDGSVIHEAVSDFFVEAGYPTTVRDGVVRGFFHGTGHGVGLDIHEAPRVNRMPQRLAAGHVVTVEPGLYDPDVGGVRIEDTVVIEKGGARILAAYPKKLVL
jgi:Xaa-Pro aminopeptidase